MNKHLRPRLAQIGRIRAGDRKGTRGAPRRLSTFRLTVPYASKPILELCATLYGGNVEAWENPELGQEWELLTTVNSIKVLILPGDCVVSYCELWSRSGLVRRCDGETILEDNENQDNIGHACTCPEDVDERLKLAKEGKACSDKTRISVMLPDVPAIGTWRLDTGSYYGATEALGQVALLQQMGITQPVEVVLAIEEQKRKRLVPGKDKPETRRFLVPTLRMLMTPKQVLLEMPKQQPKQLTTGPESAALLYGGEPEDYENAKTTAQDGAGGTNGDAAEETDAPEPEPLKNDSGAFFFGDFVGKVAHHCQNYDFDATRVLALACLRYKHDHPNSLSTGQERVVLSWLTSEGGRKQLERSLREESAAIDGFLSGKGGDKADATDDVPDPDLPFDAAESARLDAALEEK